MAATPASTRTTHGASTAGGPSTGTDDDTAHGGAGQGHGQADDGSGADDPDDDAGGDAADDAAGDAGPGAHGTGAGASWPTVAEAVAGLLGQFDTNHDGGITLAEIAGVVDPGGHHPDVMNTVVRHLVSLIDANTDGTLSSAELTAAVTHLDTNADGSLTPADLGAETAQGGLSPLLAVLLAGHGVPGGGGQPEPPEHPEPPGTPPPAAGPKTPAVVQVVDVLMARFDGNGDHALTLAELLAVVDPPGRHAKVDAALSTLVGAIDADHSGAISQAELTAAVATLDANGDGTLDPHDHVPGPPVENDAVDLIGVLLPHLRDFDAATLALAG